MDCKPPGFSVCGIFQARILEWVAISSSRRCSPPRDRTHISCVSCIVRQILYHCTTWKDCQSLLAIKAITSWCCLFDNRTLIFHWRCTVSNLARSPDIAICQDNLTSTDLKVDHLELAPGHLNTRAEDSWGCSILMVTPWKDHLCVHWFLLPGSAQFPWFLLFPRPILQLCLPFTELQLI